MSNPVNNADNFWFSMDSSTNLMVITSIIEFESKIDFKRLQNTIESRMVSFKRFKQRIIKPLSRMGPPLWVTDRNYDIRSHILRLALPDPGGEAELREMIGNLMVTPLDKSRPLWQVHLIENYGGGSVVFFRIHHCIADGIALIHVLLSLTDKEPDAPAPEKPSVKKTSPPAFNPFKPFKNILKNVETAKVTAQKVGLTVLQEVEKSFNDPSHFVEMAKFTAGLTNDALEVLAKLTVMPSDPKTAFKGRLGVRKTVAWTKPMPLQKIKTVGRAIKSATLNDVLIATVTGAMRRYLKTRNTPVNELDLRVSVPVNIRKPGTEFELGNKFSLVFLALPVYIEDPVLRLKEIKRRMDKLKTAPDAVISFGLLNIVGMLPSKTALKAAQLFSNKASGVLTNVPGPREPLYFAGREIKNMMFWVPRIGDMGIGISIFSYNGNVTVGLASDEGLFPDPQRLLDGFEDEFNALLELVLDGKIDDDPLVINDRHQEMLQRNKQAANAEQPVDSYPIMCQALTKKGAPCRNRALSESDYCKVHQNYQNNEPDNSDKADTKDIKAQIADSLSEVI
ncbi:wax ester/triacylglycerol synthase family O-acyltransferase [Desulfococcaceae bacterium HSG7]|nr:wax ester/triacylglycerol synthase family O-acyltransferase [Desulfococcaceae bacterium HSG7]